MIQLIKGKMPNVIQVNGVLWTKELMKFVYLGQKVPEHIQNHYRHQEIKDKLKAETYGKCVYCESYVSHQYPGDVEHIIPKSVYPRLTFTWKNLSFVCYWCNNNKRDYVDKTFKLLNPYIDNIEEHLIAFGPLILHINNSKRGELTWKKINLNRNELLERRTDAIKEMQNLIDKYNNETIPSLKSILKHELIENANSDKDYSMVKKQLLKVLDIKP